MTIALSVSKEEDMDVKECIVCGNGFEFKNNSKKTCSDKCRKQLSRNKKKKRTRLIENQNVTAIQNHYKAEFESMVVELYCMAFDKILSFCNKEPVHISELKFLDDLSDILLNYPDRED